MTLELHINGRHIQTKQNVCRQRATSSCRFYRFTSPENMTLRIQNPWNHFLPKSNDALFIFILKVFMSNETVRNKHLFYCLIYWFFFFLTISRWKKSNLNGRSMCSTWPIFTEADFMPAVIMGCVEHYLHVGRMLAASISTTVMWRWMPSLQKNSGQASTFWQGPSASQTRKVHFHHA